MTPIFNAVVPKHLTNGAPRSAGNTPFRRVKEENVEIDHRLADNSFDAKVSAFRFLICIYSRSDDITFLERNNLNITFPS